MRSIPGRLENSNPSLPSCWRTRLISLVCLCLVLSSCAQPQAQQDTIVIASADSLEQQLIGEITALVLREEGFRVKTKLEMGEPWMVRSALESGAVDISWEYLGTAWLVYLHHDQPLASASDTFQQVRISDGPHDIVWVAMSPYHRTAGILVNKDFAGTANTESIADLARYVANVNPRVKLCVPEELYSVAGGISGLERVYGFQFLKEQALFLSIEESYEGLRTGRCDCALGYPADLPSRERELVTLADTRGYFQASNLGVAVRTPVLERYPKLKEILPQIAEALNQQTMARFHEQLLVEGDRPAAIARSFVGRNEIIAPTADQSEPTLTISTE